MAKNNTKIVSEFSKYIKLGMSQPFLTGYIRALEVSGKNVEAYRCKKVLTDEEKIL